MKRIQYIELEATVERLWEESLNETMMYRTSKRIAQESDLSPSQVGQALGDVENEYEEFDRFTVEKWSSDTSSVTWRIMVRAD